LTGIGAFPNADRPTVIWAGLRATALEVVFQRVAAVATEFGYPPDRYPFRPHVTLARVKHRPPPQLAQIMQEHATTSWGTFDVVAVELFKSTLTPAGSRYEVLATAGLRR
jgi:2'-5' RNA ligase